MDMLQKLLDILPILLPAIIAFNVILGGVGALLSAIHQEGAAGVVNKIVGLLKKLIDLAQGNLPH